MLIWDGNTDLQLQSHYILAMDVNCVLQNRISNMTIMVQLMMSEEGSLLVNYNLEIQSETHIIDYLTHTQTGCQISLVVQLFVRDFTRGVKHLCDIVQETNPNICRGK